MRETFTYFAYGSNMYTRRLKERAPSAIPLGVGYVSGFRLAFDKISSDGSGKCNMISTAQDDDHVYGVVFDVALIDAVRLDKAEGLGAGYFKTEIHVKTEDGKRMAYTYIADRINSLLKPYDWYKDLVIRGALEHELPASYVRRLQLVDSFPDSDVKRAARNKAMLDGL